MVLGPFENLPFRSDRDGSEWRISPLSHPLNYACLGREDGWQYPAKVNIAFASKLLAKHLCFGI